MTVSGFVALSSNISYRLYQKSCEKSFSWYGELESGRVTSYFY